MPLIEQLLQLLDPARQLRAPLPVEEPTHLPELLLRMPDVQRQDRAAEQPPEPSLQARLAVDDDLHRLGGPGGEAAARRLGPCPLQCRAPRAERPEHLLVDRAMQPTILAPPQRGHHHQGGAAAVLALVPLLPPLLPAPTPSFRPAPMPLTPAARFVMSPRAAAPVQFLRCGRGGRLAVDLDDQDLPLVLRQGAFAHRDISGSGQAQDPLLDRRTRRRRPQEHPPELAGDLEAHPGGQPAEPADDQRAEAISRQAQRHVQGMHAGPAAVPRHEERANIGDRPATGPERPPGGGVRRAIAAGLPGRRVEPVVAGAEEELDQYASQRLQESQQSRLELEERRGSLLVQTGGNDLIEPLVGLPLQLVDSRWTRPDGRITLRSAHGDRLLIVPVWDMFSGQDKSPERHIAAPDWE